MRTGYRSTPSTANGSGESSGSPVQPSHMPPVSRNIGRRARTSPPGLGAQPSSVRITGNRLAAMTIGGRPDDGVGGGVEVMGGWISDLIEGRGEVGHEVGTILDAHRQTQQIVRDFQRGTGGGRMGHRTGMFDEALDGTER